MPGGKPELGETIEQSLRREFLEEVGAEIKNIRVLGVQKVESPTIYQARCVCELVKLLPQTPDPATGKIHQRKFVSISKIEQYIKWGKIGKVLFKEAFELWQKE